MFLFTFFYYRLFSPWLSPAFLIFLPPLFSSDKIGPFCFFLSLALPQFLCYPHECRHYNLVETKNRLCCCCFSSLSKSPGGHAIYCRNARVLEMQKFTPTYINQGLDVRTIFSESKLLGCMENQIFLPMVLCARALLQPDEKMR